MQLRPWRYLGIASLRRRQIDEIDTYGKIKSTSQLVCDNIKLILLKQFIFSRPPHDPLQIMVIWMHQNLPVYLFDVRYEDVPVITPSQQYIGELQ